MHSIEDNNLLGHAKILINYFSNGYKRIYGDDSQTFTFHIIAKHLVDDAALHGSLKEHSMFHFEGALGHYNNTINGVRGICEQYSNGKQYKLV